MAPPRTRPRRTAPPRRVTSRERRAARAELLARLDAAPPESPSGSFLPDDGPSPSARRRQVIWGCVAALPLAAALALWLSPGADTPDAEKIADPAAVTTADPAAASTALSRAPVPTEASPRVSQSPSSTPGGEVPETPAGHRLVAVRVADTSALDLVHSGDRVDVVGIDGRVIVTDVQVLQARRSGSTGVVVAVPEDRGAPVAGAVAATEVTVLLSPPTDPSAGAAARSASGHVP